MARKSSSRNNERSQKNDNPIFAMPPHSLEAERGVIGAIMLDPMICDNIADMVSPSDFYAESNRKICGHLFEMQASGSAIDVILLVERLKSAGDFNDIGGEAYLAEIMSSVHVTAHAVHYAKIVRNYSMQRQSVIATATALGRLNDGDDRAEVIGELEETLFEIGMNQDVKPMTMQDTLTEVYRDIDDQLNDNAEPRLLSGFDAIDNLIGGFAPGQSITIAGRPGSGKTAFATNIATNVAKQGQAVLFFSMEMSSLEVGQRLIASEGNIPLREIRQPESQEVPAKVADTGRILQQVPFYVIDNPRLTMAKIESTTKRMIRQHGVRLVVIDYLGLIESESPNKPRYEQVTDISRQLKQMAGTLQIPVIVLAQLNREAGSAKDPTPKLHHLRDSGAIEQDANIVLLIHRPSEYDEKEDKSKAIINVAKNRSGRTGSIELHWKGQFVKFENGPILDFETLTVNGGSSEKPVKWNPNYLVGNQSGADQGGFDFE